MEQPEDKTVETASVNDGKVLDFDEPTLKGENSYKSVDNLLDYQKRAFKAKEKFQEKKTVL